MLGEGGGREGGHLGHGEEGIWVMLGEGGGREGLHGHLGHARGRGREGGITWASGSCYGKGEGGREGIWVMGRRASGSC